MPLSWNLDQQHYQVYLPFLPLPPELIRSSATQHFARAEKRTCFLAWLTEPEYRVLPKDSFLFAKQVSLRIR